MQDMVNWELLRYFVALRRAGSLAGAARELHVNQTTVGRRLAALEEEVGVKLFRRTQRGCRITPAGAAESYLRRRGTPHPPGSSTDTICFGLVRSWNRSTGAGTSAS